MWSKYKFYIIGALVAGLAVFLIYRFKQNKKAAQSNTGGASSTNSASNGASSETEAHAIAKSLHYAPN